MTTPGLPVLALAARARGIAGGRDAFASDSQPASGRHVLAPTLGSGPCTAWLSPLAAAAPRARLGFAFCWPTRSASPCGAALADAAQSRLRKI